MFYGRPVHFWYFNLTPGDELYAVGMDYHYPQTRPFLRDVNQLTVLPIDLAEKSDAVLWVFSRFERMGRAMLEEEEEEEKKKKKKEEVGGEVAAEAKDEDDDGGEGYYPWRVVTVPRASPRDWKNKSPASSPGGCGGQTQEMEDEEEVVGREEGEREEEEDAAQVTTGCCWSKSQ